MDAGELGLILLGLNEERPSEKGFSDGLIILGGFKIINLPLFDKNGNSVFYNKGFKKA